MQSTFFCSEILKACTGLKGKMYYETHYSCLKKSKSNDAKYRKRWYNFKAQTSDLVEKFDVYFILYEFS
jgi:hypothetical protein